MITIFGNAPCYTDLELIRKAPGLCGIKFLVKAYILVCDNVMIAILIMSRLKGTWIVWDQASSQGLYPLKLNPMEGIEVVSNSQ